MMPNVQRWWLFRLEQTSANGMIRIITETYCYSSPEVIVIGVLMRFHTNICMLTRVSIFGLTPPAPLPNNVPALALHDTDTSVVIEY
jgi:hypothetical protein